MSTGSAPPFLTFHKISELWDGTGPTKSPLSFSSSLCSLGPKLSFPELPQQTTRRDPSWGVPFIRITTSLYSASLPQMHAKYRTPLALAIATAVGGGYKWAVAVNQASLTVFRGDLRSGCKGFNVCVSPKTYTETLTLDVMISWSASLGREIAVAPVNGRSISMQKTPGFETIKSGCLTCLTPELLSDAKFATMGVTRSGGKCRNDFFLTLAAKIG